MKQQNYLCAIVILVIIELALAALLLSGLPQFLQLAALLSHVVISIWAGLMLNWLAANHAANRGAVITYWIMAVIGFTPIQWFIALYLAMKAHYRSPPASQSQQPAPDPPPGIAAADTSAGNPPTAPAPAPATDPVPRQPKASWPAAVALLLLLLAVGINLYLVSVRLVEFQGLGVALIHALVVTPLLLVAPGLLRLAAADRVKPLVVVCQVLVYLLLAMSWTIFLLK